MAFFSEMTAKTTVALAAQILDGFDLENSYLRASRKTNLGKQSIEVFGPEVFSAERFAVAIAGESAKSISLNEEINDFLLQLNKANSDKGFFTGVLPTGKGKFVIVKGFVFLDDEIASVDYIQQSLDGFLSGLSEQANSVYAFIKENY